MISKPTKHCTSSHLPLVLLASLAQAPATARDQEDISGHHPVTQSRNGSEKRQRKVLTKMSYNQEQLSTTFPKRAHAQLCSNQLVASPKLRVILLQDSRPHPNSSIAEVAGTSQERVGLQACSLRGV